MSKYVLPLLLTLAACHEPIGPDPTGGNGGDGAGASSPGGAAESGDRIKARMLRGDDGSRVPDGWYDAELETKCTWETAGDGKTRCIPEGPTATLFSDSDCTKPIVVSACNPPRFMRAIVAGCTAIDVFEVGAEVDPQSVWRRADNGSCVSGTKPDAPLYGGTEIAPVSFVGSALEMEQ